MKETGIDIEQLVRTIRADGYAGDGAAVWRYAQRVLTHRLKQARQSGNPIDAATEQVLRQALDEALHKTADQSTNDIQSPDPQANPTFARRNLEPSALPSLAHLHTLIGSAFSAPVDGSQRRALVLAWRALRMVERALGQAPVWSVQVWRLRWKAYRAINQHRRAARGAFSDAV
ncbi:MAG: hypothetical protein PPP56_11660 [Longimonas sp.]|uniref:hypothetical protein n=1 Tax=Longimonas sp. TaxID=2039626 RepID=UPI00334B9089